MGTVRVPDTVGVARKWMLAGGVALLVGLALVAPRWAEEPPQPADHSLTLQAPDVAPGGDATPDAPAGPDPSRGVPVRLRIAELGVEAPVDEISLGAEHVLVPPADPQRVGWWEDGARPGGRRGAVVLTGHSVQRGDGVFDELAALREGDRVEVTTAVGVVSYRVDEVAALGREQLAQVSERLFSATGASRLVLVTCGDYRHGEYHGNVVVTALPDRGRAPE